MIKINAGSENTGGNFENAKKWANEWLENIRKHCPEIEMRFVEKTDSGNFLFKFRHPVTGVEASLETHGFTEEEYHSFTFPPRVYWNGSSTAEPKAEDWLKEGFSLRFVYEKDEQIKKHQIILPELIPSNSWMHPYIGHKATFDENGIEINGGQYSWDSEAQYKVWFKMFEPYIIEPINLRFFKYIFKDTVLRNDESLTYYGIHDISIEQDFDELKVQIELERPGLLIGKGGSNINRLTEELEKYFDVKIHFVIKEKQVFL